MARYSDIEERITLGDLYRLVCDHLPNYWDFELRLTKDGASIELFDDCDDRHDVCRDDLSTAETVLALVNHARLSEGLAPVELPEHLRD